jgi:crossover junction endodeoxyribonuclease RuvC
MRVLGIDPGLTRCGYAVLEAHGTRTVRALSMGVLRTPPSSPLPQRLAELKGELAALIAEFAPNAMSVGQASGLALAEAAAAGCDVVQYTPNQVKNAVAGWGGADKAQVQKMVQARLGLTVVPEPPDAADAAALALCHLAMAPMAAQVAAQQARQSAQVAAAQAATAATAPTGR